MTTRVGNKVGNYRVVGTRPIRHDGLDKVTGKAKYGADVQFVGLLHGKVLRSPHPHARIKSIDTSKAEAFPGVRAVITADDLPIVDDTPIDFGEVFGNARVLAANSMAKGKVLYRGHAVAALAATDPHVAEEALGLIEVDYELLKPLLSVHESMKDDGPLLHETLTRREVVDRFTRGTDTGKTGNVASRLQLKQGDVAEGFKEADVVVEREFNTVMVHQGYIEPHNVTVNWAPDGDITVWLSTQGAFNIRGQLAAVLKLPESVIKVVPMEIGGGFGGKINIYMEILAATLSKKTGHPVKMVMSRKEVFEGTGPTSGTYMRAKFGAKKNGKLTAAEIYLAYEAGAFPGSPVAGGSGTCLAPYNIPNVLINGLDVVVNKPKTAAYRAPGSPQAALAVETLIDELAEKLGMDPIEFRLLNASKEGDRQATGVPHGSIGCREVEEAMKAHPHYRSPLKGHYRGRGIAMGYWGNGGMNSSSAINVNSDGRVSLITGSVDIGGARVALAMQAAEVLGIDAADVIPTVGDTDSIGWTGLTGGSRTAFSTGIAVINAAEQVKAEMCKRAALLWEVQPDDVEFNEGTFLNSKNPDEKFTFKEIAAQQMKTGGPINAAGVSNPRKVAGAFAGNIVDVEVDPETGKVTVLRYTVVEDVGQAAHPSYVEGQLQGGTVQGIGWALNEEYHWTDDGAMANPTFLDYRMPTSLDLPMIDTVLVNVPNPDHPFGVRGVGEVSIVPPLAAMANAVSHAIGVRMDKLPMSPGAILEALESKKKNGG